MTLIRSILFFLVCLFSISKSFGQTIQRSNVLLSDDVSEVLQSVNDEDGNTYILGQFIGNLKSFSSYNNSIDLYVAKYDAELELQWINHIGSDDHEYNADLAIDDSSNILLTAGYKNWGKFSPSDSVQSEGDYDVALAKYNSEGDLLWVKNIVQGTGIQNPMSIDVDKDNNYIISGFFSDSAKFSGDTLINTTSGIRTNFIVKLDNNGFYIWSKKIEVSSLSRIFSVKAFEEGYYFTGRFRGEIYFDVDTLSSHVSNRRDVFLYKTNFDGVGQWVRRTYGTENDLTGTVSRDIYGNVYYTGNFKSPTLQLDSTANTVSNVILENKGGDDIFIFKYNKNGTLLWARGYGSTSDDWGQHIEIVDRLLYLTGKISDTTIFGKDTLITSNSGDAEVFIAGFDDKGNPFKSIIINASGYDLGRSLVVNNPNGAIVSGYFESSTFPIGDSTYYLTGSRGSFIAEYEAPFSSAFTTINKISCTGAEDGRLIVTPFLGASPYTYEWSTNVVNSNDSLAYDLSPGTYSVTITDALDNTTSESINLTEPAAVTIALDSINNITCYNGNDGEIYISVSGGTGSYSYDWSGGSGADPEEQDQTGLSAADYIVKVTDNNACEAIDTFTVSQPGKIQFTGSQAYGTSTQGGSDGAIGLKVTGGIPGFDYSWTGPDGPYPNSDTLSGLIGGNYTVEVTDTNGCTADTTLNVSDEGNIVLSIVNNLPVTCKNDSNGYVVTDIENENGTIAYTWKKDGVIIEGPTAGKKSLSDLAGGTYWVIAQETSGSERIDSVQFIVDEATDSLTTTIAGTNPDCFGHSNGVINLSVSGGVSPYNYAWSYNGATTEDLSNVPASSDYYVVTVTDDYGCEAIDSIQITEPAAMTNNITIDQIIFCNGESSGKLTAHAGGGVAPYSYFWDDPGNQTDSSATNLTAGLYEVQIIDQNNCDIYDTLTLTEPDVFALNAIDSINVTCFGGEDGAISINVEGGTTPYQYIWFDTPDNVPTRNDLDAGTYQVDITDLYGCNEFKRTIDIEEPASALTIDTLTGSVDPVSCFGLADGALEMTGSGGWGGLEYAFNDASYGAQTAFGSLPGDTYEIKVRDNMGCVDSMEVDINEPAELVAGEYDHTDVSCNGLSDGLLTATKTGGNSGFEFSIDNLNWIADSTFSGLTANSYRIRIRDNKNCADSVDIVIQEPDVLTLSEVTASHQDVSCYGLNNGALMVTKAGGNDTFEFQLNNNGWVADSTFQNLPATAYKIKVRDNLGCMDSIDIAIAEPDSLILTTSNQNGPSCFGLSDGTVELSAAGGNTGMEFSADQFNWSTENIFNDLAAGSYTFYARDNEQCSDSASVELTEPAALTIAEQPDAHIDVLCYGDATGELAVAASGGTGSYEYTADGSNYQSASLFTQLTANNYNVQVRDDNNCMDSVSIAITQPANPLSLDAATASVTCHGDEDGTITIEANGGIEPHQFSLTKINWSSNGNFADLAPGSYLVYIRDSHSCIDSVEVNISEPTAISILSENLDGSDISITAVGGSGNLTYELNGLENSTGEFTVTTNGEYTVTISDARGCELQSNSFNVAISGIGDHMKTLSGRIYPVPARDMINIEVRDLKARESYELVLHSLEGQLVVRKPVMTDNRGMLFEQLDISHLASGIYMIRLNDRVIQQKIVKE